MANPLKTFLKALLGKNQENVTKEEIEKAKLEGEIAAGKAAKRVGIVEQVEIDADAARIKAGINKENTRNEDEERTN